MKRFMRYFVAGVFFALGVFAVGLGIDGLRAAQVSTFTGPGGSNPIKFPAVLADLNALINSINATLAPGGTGTVPGLMNITGSPTSTNSNVTVGLSMLQLNNDGSWVIGAATNTACRLTNTTACLVIQDVSGTIHYIPAY